MYRIGLCIVVYINKTFIVSTVSPSFLLSFFIKKHHCGLICLHVNILIYVVMSVQNNLKM